MMAENNVKMLKIQQCVVANKLPRNRPYICNICFKHFETPSKLARHYLIHTGQKPFECDVCHKTFRQLVHLERHQLTHNLPFKCSICQRHFKNLKTFVKHQQLHNETCQNDVKQVRRLLEANQEKPVYGVYNTFTPEERWALYPCSKSDPTYSTTKKRKNVHACTICGKMFPSQSKLDRHALIHTGQRPFKCVLCSKSFRQSTHLKIHQLTHSEERPFQCCFCQKGFKIQSKLLKHKQIHTRNKTHSLKARSPESCPLPNKFNAKQDSFENGDVGESEENNPLEVHSIYIVPFQCPECEECFESEQILNGHKCFPARGGKIPGRLKRSYNYKTIVKKILAKLKRAGGKKLGNFQSEKKLLKNSFLKNCDLISGEQNSDHTQRTFLSSLGKHGTCKTVGNKKMKTLTLPFSWQKQFQSQNMGKNLKDILATENMLTIDNSVNNKDISIYGSSGEEFFNNCEVLQCGFSVPSENIHTGHKICPCDKCEKVFPSISKLQRHYLIHTGQRPFGCNVCGKSFRQSAHLKRHKLTHIEKIPYRRSLCHAEFGHLNKLFIHPGDNINCNPSQQCQALGFQKYEVSEPEPISEIKVQAESQDFILGSHCRNKQPYFSNVLLESEQSHLCCSYSGRPERNDGLLYQCSVCSKSFRSPSKLERHYLIHAGQKPFECSVCGKTFRQAPHWKRHQLTHFKERPQEKVLS